MRIFLGPRNSATTTLLLQRALAGDEKYAQILRDLPDQATPSFKKTIRFEALRDVVGWLRAQGIKMNPTAYARALAAAVSGISCPDLDRIRNRLTDKELQELSLYTDLIRACTDGRISAATVYRIVFATRR